MASVNQVTLIGFVGDEPKIIQTKGGKTMSTFRIATTEKGYIAKDGRQIPDVTDWHSITVFGVVAEKVIRPYVHKGNMLYIQGKLKTRTYDDDKGIKRFTTEVVADNVQLLARRSQSPAGSSPVTYASGTPLNYDV